MSPRRIQRQRTKGWRMPEGAVYVGRPSKWGNPFRLGHRIYSDDPLYGYLAKTVPGGATGLSSLIPYSRGAVADAYCWWLIEQPRLMLALDELRGRDLVCWCLVTDECHADVLLELANEGTKT